MPSLSILLPVYNGAAYLDQSIRSVLEQSYTDFELLVLDDESDDASPSITARFRDSRVRYSRNGSRFGLYKTLNRGFEEAQAPLVRLWSHDDVMLPGSLDSFVAFAERFPSAGMIYCDFFSIDEMGRRTGRDLAYTGQRRRTSDLCSSGLSALLFFCFGCLPGNISTVMLRRSVWAGTGGFLSGFQQAPDFDMWLKVSREHDIGFVRTKCIELREHPAQLGRLGHKQMTTISEEFPIYEKLREYLQDSLPGSEFERYFLRERGRQHMHWVMKAFVNGDLKSARRGWSAVSLYGHPYQQLAIWLISVNGRIGGKRGEDLFDVTVPLIVPDRSYEARLACREL